MKNIIMTSKTSKAGKTGKTRGYSIIRPNLKKNGAYKGKGRLSKKNNGQKITSRLYHKKVTPHPEDEKPT